MKWFRRKRVVRDAQPQPTRLHITRPVWPHLHPELCSVVPFEKTLSPTDMWMEHRGLGYVREDEPFTCRTCGRDTDYVDEHGKAECDACIATYDVGEWRAERARGK